MQLIKHKIFFEEATFNGRLQCNKRDMLKKLQIGHNHGSLKLKAIASRNKTSYKQNKCLVKKGECLQRTYTKLQRKNRKHIRKTSTMSEREDDKPIHGSREQMSIILILNFLIKIKTSLQVFSVIQTLDVVIITNCSLVSAKIAKKFF